VMIARIDGNSIDGCSGNQRVIAYDAPRSHIAATVRRFPYTAANRPEISHDAAIGRSSRIDCYDVNSTFGGRVIKTARTTSHPLRLRTERSKSRRDKRHWTARIELLIRSSRDATRHTRVLRGGGAHPR